jgi:hypothetical protein
MKNNLKTIKMTKDKRVDTYIAKSANFARPVLHHLRNFVHDACPDVEESFKWGFPNFFIKTCYAAWLQLTFIAHLLFGKALS